MMSVVYLDSTELMRTLLTPELAARLPGLVVHGEPGSAAEVIARLQGARVVLNGHTPMDAGVLECCRDLRSIVFLGSGATSYIDVPAAARLGIAVRTVPGYGDRAVAEHTMALMLAAARGIGAMDRGLRAGVWDTLEGMELAGKRLGVIGTGGIGRAVIRLAAAFGMEVVAWNRTPPVEALAARLLPLPELLATSDVVSLHLALNPETRHFLDPGRMKRGAILVNTARGGLVEEAALLAALRSGQLRHAALDVFATEPLPEGHALTTLANVTLSAHAAYKTPEASARLLERAIDLAAADLAAMACP